MRLLAWLGVLDMNEDVWKLANTPAENSTFYYFLSRKKTVSLLNFLVSSIKS